MTFFGGRFDPKTTDEATKGKLLEVLKEAVGVLEGKSEGR